MSIRKHCVIGALNWLMANNPLYKNIRINHRLLDTWEDQFIPSGITDNMVQCDPDHYKRVSYAIDLCDGNYENDLDAAIADTGIKGDHIHSGCVYSDIDDGRQNPTLRLLSAIGNIKATTLALDTSTTKIVTYRNKGRLIPLNDWEDPHYFTDAFPCLFPFGSGGHLKQRKRPMSLEAWAKWTLQHNSHR